MCVNKAHDSHRLTVMIISHDRPEVSLHSRLMRETSEHTDEKRRAYESPTPAFITSTQIQEEENSTERVISGEKGSV